MDERWIRKLIKQTIETCEVPKITATMIADVAYQKMESLGWDMSQTSRSGLKEVAAVVLNEMFEPDEDAATLLKKADALEAWAKARGLL